MFSGNLLFVAFNLYFLLINNSVTYIFCFSGRLSESPSNSVDVVATDGGRDKKHSSDCESDADMDPASWQKLFPEEELRNLQPHEKKRQDVINGRFRLG